MTDFRDDTDDYDEQEQQPAKSREYSAGDVRAFRRDAKKWAEAEPELTRLQRENLLLRTPGLDKLSDKQMKALFSTHEGEMTPDSLRASAQDLGFVAPPPPEVPDSEMAAQQRLINASAGASPAPGNQDALDNATIAQANSVEEVMAVVNARGMGVQQ